MSMNNNGKVLFNEKCGICNFEIQHYKKRSLLEFSDCSQMDDKYLKKLHVIFTDGKELAGVDAFIYVWKFSNLIFKNKLFSLCSVLLLEGIFFYNFRPSIIIITFKIKYFS